MSLEPSELDEEILQEDRLSPEEEVILYNMALKQDDMYSRSTNMLLSELDKSPMYLDMIKKGLLTYSTNGGGASSVVANIRVTLKGLRYCLLFSEEIEPLRLHDIAGNLRQENRTDIPPEDSTLEQEDDSASQEGEQQDAMFPHMMTSFNPTHDKSFSLNEKHMDQISKIEMWRREQVHHKRKLNFQKVSQLRQWNAPSGETWIYVVIDNAAIQINGVRYSDKSVQIPTAIEDMPVVALAKNALAKLDNVEEIICSEFIEIIEEGAFKNNPTLKRLLLPDNLDYFTSNWVDQSLFIEELKLPGKLEVIERDVMINDHLTKLSIGRAAREIEPGTFQSSTITEFEIDERNPYLIADDAAIYSKDEPVFIALVCPITELTVAPGTVKMAIKSCHGFPSLQSVNLPDSIIEIDDYAFSGTGLIHFVAPPNLERIGVKAFLYCTDLESVALNNKLEIIDDAAFMGSTLPALDLPASIKHIGNSVTKETRIIHSGPHCSLTLDPACKDQFLDGRGGLYRYEDDGTHMVQLIDSELEDYTVYDGTVAIDPHAFAYHNAVTTVRVPASVVSIGDSAFRMCKNLKHVILPDSIQSIGDRAFYDSSIEEFYVPANLIELGERALVSYGAHYGDRLPSLKAISASPENEHFYIVCGMLCRKTEEGASVVVFANCEERVVFPHEITRVEDYAFSNSYGIDYLSLNPELRIIGSGGLATKCWIRHIHIELAQPYAGREVFDFFFPNTQSGIRGISLGLGGANWVHIPGIVEQLDLCLTTARNYNATREEEAGISAYEQTRLILERFDDPVMLTKGNRTAMERLIRNHIVDISVDVALHDDRSTFDELIALDFINASNLDAIIERVSTLRDAATSAHLLEAKRMIFSEDAFDYDL